MNKDKTTLFTAGLNLVELGSIAEIGFQLGSYPVRYLGLPLVARKLQTKDYSPLIDSLSRKFNGWAERMLSFSGRLQLIKAVVYGTLNFWMTVFVLPKACLKKIEQMCSRYLWNGNLVKKTGIKVAWVKLCLPKEEGGLGLRDLRLWNKVLSLKLVWLQFAKSGSLWVAWTKAHYYPNTCFWDSDIPSNSSWIWKLLQGLKPLAQSFIKCALANGKFASFWFDDWCELGPLIRLFGDNGPRHLGVSREALVAQTCDLEGWKFRAARSDQALTLQTFLTTLPLPSHSELDDRYEWMLPHSSKNHGEFSASLTWDYLRAGAPIQTWTKAIWFKGHTPKHAFTFWVTHLDRLPMRERLCRWGMNVTNLCCLCSHLPETRDHIFLHCHFASNLWRIVSLRFGLSNCYFMDWDSLITWLLGTTPSLPSLLKKLVTQLVIYLVWKERNSRLHSNISVPYQIVFRQLDRSLRDKLLANLNKKKFSKLFQVWITHMS